MKRILGIVFVCFLIVLIVGMANANNIMTVEVDVITVPEKIVRVEIQNYLDFGNVNVGEESEEITIQINNTGNTAVIVTPELLNSSEIIFSNLYFRDQKTSNKTQVISQRMGDFSLNISKPGSSGVAKADFWMKLDLRNINNIEDDILNHRTNVTFFAMENE